ncbi:DUF58 domain-containing protein [Radiobacillus sp. PE A8.2]|uniref:DUF58 domain-containing protein n=1 Tax=Radiobacillus sp. PE A8.2 TaxID=3380349 RepID=UPI00388E366C
MIHLLKQGYGKLYRRFNTLLAISMVVLFTAVLFHQRMLFIAVGILMAYSLIGFLFERFTGNSVFLDNEKRAVVLFPGEQEKFSIFLTNKTKLGRLDGHLTFTTDENIIVENAISNDGNVKRNHTIYSPLPNRSKVELELSVQADRRGVSRISDVTYRYSNPFSFEKIALRAIGVLQLEVIVYPEKKQVFGLNEIMTNRIGTSNSPFSLHQDQLEQIGTRDYFHSDSMQHIHWKASAKKQQLQTKLFEKKMDMSWTILVNLGTYSRLGNMYLHENMEDYLAAVAYLCEQAIRAEYAVALHINLGTIGVPSLRLDHGTGKLHLKRIFEMLARINHTYPLIPVSRMIRHVDRDILKHRAIVFVGEMDDVTKQYVARWKRRGVKVYRLHELEDQYRIIQE